VTGKIGNSSGKLASESDPWSSCFLAALLVAGLVCSGLGASPAWAFLPPGNAVTDPAAILRDALPIESADLQKLQHQLEGTSDDLRAKRWGALSSSVRRSQGQLGTRGTAITASLPPADRDASVAALGAVAEQLLHRRGAVGGRDGRAGRPRPAPQARLTARK
jgi:peptidylprolyl isomerase